MLAAASLNTGNYNFNAILLFFNPIVALHMEFHVLDI